MGKKGYTHTKIGGQENVYKKKKKLFKAGAGRKKIHETNIYIKIKQKNILWSGSGEK